MLALNLLGNSSLPPAQPAPNLSPTQLLATPRRRRPIQATSVSYGRRPAHPHLPLAPLFPPLRLDSLRPATNARSQPIFLARVSSPAWLRRILSIPCHLLDGAPGTGPREGPPAVGCADATRLQRLFGMSAGATTLSQSTMAAANTGAPSRPLPPRTRTGTAQDPRPQIPSTHPALSSSSSRSWIRLLMYATLETWTW